MFSGLAWIILCFELGAFLVVHLTIVHQLGLANPKRPEPRPGKASAADNGAVEKLKPFFPNYVLDEVIAWAAFLAVLVALATVLPAGLEEKANALETPAHVKPEWYFLSAYQLLKIVPREVGIMAPMVAIGALALLPFLDRNPEVRARKRLIALLIGVVAAVVTVGLTVWGYYS